MRRRLFLFGLVVIFSFVFDSLASVASQAGLPASRVILASEDLDSVIYVVGAEDYRTEVLRVPFEQMPFPIFEQFVALSPDDKYLAYILIPGDNDGLVSFDRAVLWLVDLETQEHHKVKEFPDNLWTAPLLWSPDSQRLAYVQIAPIPFQYNGGLELWWFDVSASEHHFLTSDQTFTPDVFYQNVPAPLAWSPDGLEMYYAIYDWENQKKTVYYYSLSTTEPRVETLSLSSLEMQINQTYATLPCDVPIYSQRDPKWKLDIMRTCGKTIGGAGCALTSTAMVFTYYGQIINPAGLNQCLGGSACPIYWGTAANNCSGSKVSWQGKFGFSWSAMEQQIAQGKPPILELCKGGCPAHFVVVVSGSGSSANNYTINDPGNGTIRNLSAYVNEGYTLEALMLYSGTPSCNLTPPDTTLTLVPAEYWLAGNEAATFSWIGSDPPNPPSELTYSYRLQRQPDAPPPWSQPSTLTNVIYTNQPHGKYVFAVRTIDAQDLVDPSPATYEFGVDRINPSPPQMAIGGAGCIGILNNTWQNTCRDPSFTWAATDNDSGIVGYYRYWGETSNQDPSDFDTNPSFDPGAIAPEDGYASYYLNLKSVDQVGLQSSIATFALLYDGTIPTVTFQINNGSNTSWQVDVVLNVTAYDTGSDVSWMRMSNNLVDWSNWQPYSETAPWTILNMNKRNVAVYLQVADQAGNVSAVASDTIYLEFAPPMPHSTNFRICQDVVASGGAVGLVSASYMVSSAFGQPTVSANVTSSSPNYTHQGGFMTNVDSCLPIEIPATETYTLTHSVLGSAGGTHLSSSYWLNDTLGQTFAAPTILSSASYQLTSGFWHNLADWIQSDSGSTNISRESVASIGALPPSIFSESSEFSLIVNGGDLYSNSPYVSLELLAPQASLMRIGNTPVLSDTTWQTYSVTQTWVLSTSSPYVLPSIVYVEFQDQDGNIFGPFSAQVIYDPLGPEGSIDVLTMQPPTATLALTAWDNSSGVVEMRVSDDPALTGAAWQAYTEDLDWQLTGDFVYAQFRDQSGNVSAIYRSDIWHVDIYVIHLPLIVKR